MRSFESDFVRLRVFDTPNVSVTTNDGCWALIRANLIFVRGAPGSGKTTVANKLQDLKFATHVFETDEFWIRPNGFYDFNFKLLSAAHEWNHLRVSSCLFGNFHDVVPVISNTSIPVKSMKDYIMTGLEMQNIYNPGNKLNVTVIECHENYGSVHNVPEETVAKMRANFQTSDADYTNLLKEIDRAQVERTGS